ncbi:MAG: trypsin-like serine protease [Anaerolineae bacterium]
MRKATVLVAALLALLVMAMPVGAIVGGDLDGEGHPNVGLMIAEIDGEPAWRCSGTLIAPTVFLTAGHCTGDGATGARIWFDTDLTGNAEYPYGGDTSFEGTPVPHPLYAWGGADPHDVGVVILDEPVTGIEPAALPGEALLNQLKQDGLLREGGPESASFTMVGYGGNLASWPPPELDYDLIRRVAESEYVALTQVWLHLSQRAVFEEGGTCGGDSGGPVFWVEDGAGKKGRGSAPEETVVAVTSWGDPYCIATGFYYRVDTPEILAWVYSQIPSGE